MMPQERFLFRHVFDRAALEAQAERFAEVWPRFDQARFVGVAEGFGPLGFKERAEAVLGALEDCLPGPFERGLEVLVAALPPVIEEDALEGTAGFICWPLGQWIARHGLDHFEASMAALYRLTQSFSAEMAIRPFLSAHPERTLDRLAQWAQDPNPHVRRLVSEGTRPRLPWAPALPQYKADPRPLFPLLEALRRDRALYVRRSVANHLNDVSKDHPDLAVELLARWNAEAPSPEVAWITGHALRSLIKAGHRGALSLMGFETDPQVELRWTLRPERLQIGQELRFGFELSSTGDGPQNLVVDFALDFLKAGGQSRPKVFKLARRTLAPGQVAALSKGLVLAQRTTRKLYPGPHELAVLVGGKEVGRFSFELEA